MDDHQNQFTPDIPDAPPPIDKNNFPPELREAQNGTILLDSDSGIGVIILYNALRGGATGTPEEWARPILDLYTSGLAQPATYMELLAERDVAIWARFTFEKEWEKFEFSFAGQACAVELATAGGVPVTGHRWRDAPLKLEPFGGAVERTVQDAANLMKERPLPLDLTAVNTDGYTPDAARSIIFAPWLDSSGAEVDPGAMRAYLQLYDEAIESCPEGRLAVFVMPEKRTFASRDPEAIIGWASRQAQRDGVSVYLHTALHILPDGVGQCRGSIEKARAVIGLFADIDAWAPDRKKSKETLCPTAADAIQVVEKFDELYQPIATTLLIFSGNGCYPALLFKEPYLITNDEDRAWLDSLSRRFRLALHLIASKSGWTGAVEGCDLAKVLRLPGTIHSKDPKNPKPVGVLYHYPERRYTLLSLDELLPPLTPDQPSVSRTTKTRQSVDGTLVLDAEARPPADKLEFMLRQDVTFNWTWTHQRSDFKDDNSQSVYDLSLAHQAASFGWSDQEIVDLLIANRREHGGAPKLREDYYLRTLILARESAAKWAAGTSALAEESEESTESKESPASVTGNTGDVTADDGAAGASDNQTNRPPPGSPPPASPPPASPSPDAGQVPPSDPNSQILTRLSGYLGVTILVVKKYKSDPGSMYEIVTALGSVKLGSVNDLIKQDKLRCRIADVTGVLFRKYKPVKWDKIVQLLLRVCQVDDLGPDATEGGAIHTWLSQYLRERPVHNDPEPADAGKEPFRLKGEIYINIDNFRCWLQLRKSEKFTQRVLATTLRRSGAQNAPSLDVTINGKRTTRGVWKLPPGV